MRSPTRLVALVSLGAALLAAPSVADAAKVKVTSSSAPVSDDGVAAVTLKNPNRSTARGTLTLVAQGERVGSKKFAIPARRTRTVGVPISLGAAIVLASEGSLAVVASAKAKGKGTSRRSITLTYAGAGDPGGSGGGGGGGGGSAPLWTDGRYQGNYATSNTTLAFNVAGGRLFTGPFDSFYVDTTCRNTDPEYTGDQQWTSAANVGPVEATITSDGSFSGSGVYRPSPTSAINWTISGRISGTTVTGRFSVNYYYGGGSSTDPCTGSVDFTARWYGDYEL